LKDLLSHVSFTEAQAKKLMRDLLSGTAYLHSRNIVHRDFKSSNLLYSNDGRLKICDFGLARKLASKEAPLTQEVITMWYRPPELLLGAERYSLEVDMWSIGCIMAEIMLKTQIFKGSTEVDQM
jgi:serine/threonine protein kinase